MKIVSTLVCSVLSSTAESMYVSFVIPCFHAFEVVASTTHLYRKIGLLVNNYPTRPPPLLTGTLALPDTSTKCLSVA